ncbi:phosphoenolpyruvate synthase [Paramicrobacterium chengjingii]|uniref:phosphoenolpyruvate synthase n=1 Tax=Paramicrobacterium chengjingii TaxID=2769067 RepID=UPI001420E882|nr:phosphoenolpyruvate synthase [Microbacterium chengjingii]
MAEILKLANVERTMVETVGGKGAHLGELMRVGEVHVPDGFCVTTEAYQRVVAASPVVAASLAVLSRLTADDRGALAEVSASLRHAVESIELPSDLVTSIADAHVALGEDGAYAVRSSATAEDLPSASFAGQQDSYLNVMGFERILDHIRRCWASLFTERAVSYRVANNIDHGTVDMAVIVQRMVPADAAGVLFTADPVTSNRTIATVEAVRGLGDSFVSGQVLADSYTVRDGEIVSASKTATEPVLAESQVVRLVELGRRIEKHMGGPQDIEWCCADGTFFIVQSRPITTLYPLPPAPDDGIHVYASVGHQQMMTDAMKPLGLSVWQLTALRTMAEAGSRLFVDITAMLTTPEGRTGLTRGLGASEPLIADALQTVINRDIVPLKPGSDPGPMPPGVGEATAEPEPGAVEQLIATAEQSIAAFRRSIRHESGPALFDAILTDIGELRRLVSDPQSMQVLMAGIEASRTLNETLSDWLGETNAADVLAQSVPHNVTAEMGLALLDVADAMRPHADVVAHLKNVASGSVTDGRLLDDLRARAGGPDAAAALSAFLDDYGMRCVGEIDVTRERWDERPELLVPALVANIDNVAPGESARRFEHGRLQALAKRDEVLMRLRELPDGERKVAETEDAIRRLRAYTGYREYPKYVMINRYSEYRRALLGEAQRQVRSGLLRQADDIFFLRFDELQQAVRTQQVDHVLIHRRRDEFARDETLTPPRLLTSVGETISGAYHRDDVPAGALPGLAVSAGTVEGRARVVSDIGDADLEPGDILVTAFTDPSWTPVFLGISGLVTEVGGVMTHGAVIAREYGLPAVVAVENATRLIRDGQRIRVNGTDGFVELLEGTASID